MPLSAGPCLGPYEILSALGVGGMGEVYRARDTKLNRDVALKVISDTFALDPDRVARFTREAQVLASLNHPHIAAIYGFEDSGAIHALVLELVEGETLADRIARGPIQIDEALPIARQIAEALEAAHEQGIIHRDLKPANIKITPEAIRFCCSLLIHRIAKNLDPQIVERVAMNDPGNRYAVNYMWGTNGIGYDEAKVRAIMPDAPVDSWKLVFDPAVASKFKDCGIALLDSPTDVVPLVLIYLGKDPNSESASDLKQVEDMLLAVRPFIRMINSSTYTDALANGDICIAVAGAGPCCRPATGRLPWVRVGSSSIRSRRRAPSPGSTCWRFPRMHRTPATRTRSSISCNDPKSPPRIPTS